MTMPHSKDATARRLPTPHDTHALVVEALKEQPRYGLFRTSGGGATFIPAPRTVEKPNPDADVTPATFLRLTRERPSRETVARPGRVVRAVPDLRCYPIGEDVIVLATVRGVARPLEFRVPLDQFSREVAEDIACSMVDRLGIPTTTELRIER